MAKRTRTWGTISKTKSGVYRIRYPLSDDPITGKRRQASETIHGTKKDAELRLAELRILNAPTEHIRRNITVDQFWNRYYYPYIKKNQAPATVRGYESVYRCHIKPQFGNEEMETIRVSEVKSYLEELTYGSAKSLLRTMRAMFNYAEDGEYITRNVMDRRFKLPNKNTSRRMNEGIYDKDTLDELLEEMTDEYWLAGFIVSAFAGLRREEAFGLKREDIEFHDGYATLSVKRTVQYINKELVISDECEKSPNTKTPESERIAILVNPYAARLKEIMNEKEREHDIWMLDDGFGRPISPDRAATAYKRWFTNHPFIYVPWKNLRSSYTTMLEDLGVPIETAAKLLGHSNISTTYAYYTKPKVKHFTAVLTEAFSCDRDETENVTNEQKRKALTSKT